MDGFLVTAGWGTYGFKAAPIVGTTLAELIATGETPGLIEPFALERFYTDTLVSELAAAAVSHWAGTMATQMPCSLEIAQEATSGRSRRSPRSWASEPDEYDLYGRYKAKVDLSVLDRLADQPDGKLICVTAITPTKAGEGKTTTSVSLTQGLGHIGRRSRSASARPRSARSSGSRAARPAAATRRSSRWRT